MLVHIITLIVLIIAKTSPLCMSNSSAICEASPPVYVGIDAIVKLVRVVDGDTINAIVSNVSVKFSNHIHVGESITIRFADINAPELYVNGERNEPGWKSRSVLIDLLNGKDNIYLDIDDEEIFDHYDRLIAVVYVKFNETHFMNVNKWLVDNGYARIWDFPNATDPYHWSLYVETNSIKLLAGNSATLSSRRGLRNEYTLATALYTVIAISLVAGYVLYSRYLSKTQSNRASPSFTQMKT